MTRPWTLSLLALTAALVAPLPARAHEFRPGSLDITAVGNGRYEVTWSPAPDADRSQIVFPPSCARDAGTPSARRFLLDCGPAGLAGSAVAVTGLAPLRDEVVVRLRLEGGAELTAMLGAARPSLDVPAAPADRGPLATILSYAAAGAGHLLTGLDHVAFVLGLLLLVRRTSALVRAVTAFTLAHSLTLALQVLGAVKLPPAPVEAAIALSVLLLAREILRAPTPEPAKELATPAHIADAEPPSGTEPPATPPHPATPAARGAWQTRPWIAAFGFGLLHGLGFAGGLASFHLDRGQIAAALFGFNLGLEAAQIALILVALALARALRPLVTRSPAWTHRVLAYSLGGAAAFWLLQRTLTFWSS